MKTNENFEWNENNESRIRWDKIGISEARFDEINEEIEFIENDRDRAKGSDVEFKNSPIEELLHYKRISEDEFKKYLEVVSCYECIDADEQMLRYAK